MAEAAGAEIIDLNLGCPAKEVTGAACGASLMRDLDAAERLITAATSATTRPVTVKMRLGWDDASRNAPELARRAQQAGAAALTVHGRTRQQFYTGAADWAAVREVKEAVSVPVIVNGDITDVAHRPRSLGAFQRGCGDARARRVRSTLVGRQHRPGALRRLRRRGTRARRAACDRARSPPCQPAVLWRQLGPAGLAQTPRLVRRARTLASRRHRPSSRQVTPVPAGKPRRRGARAGSPVVRGLIESGAVSGRPTRSTRSEPVQQLRPAPAKLHQLGFTKACAAHHRGGLVRKV